MASKILLAFDFDRTITVENSDFHALELLSKEDQDKLWATCEDGQWQKFVNTVFETLAQRNVSIEEFRNKMKKLGLVNGMPELFKHIMANEDLYDCIIISDANAWFIDIILEENDLKSAVKKIYTNPTTILENKQLFVKPCHSHNHSSCPHNMCKRDLLQRYIQDINANGRRYSTVCYFGDSTNDLCACECLGESDFAFPRKGFSLEEKLNKISDNGNGTSATVQAKVVPWETGFEIQKFLQNLNSSK